MLALLPWLAFGCTKANPAYVGGGGGGNLDGGGGGRLDSGGGGRLDGASIPDVVRPRDDAAPPVPDATVDRGVTPNRPVGVDILFVIDNSPGMGAEQARLAATVEKLTERIDKIGEVRIGIVTTDLGIGSPVITSCTANGDAGKLYIRGGCPDKPQGARFITWRGGSANVKDVKDALSCLLQVGQSGCGFEQPLEAMRVALSGANPGFLRQNAALAVVILSNEDDCSAAQTQLYLPTQTVLGPYSSFRCFEYGVICDGQKPRRQTATYNQCVPGQAYLHNVQQRYINFLKGLKPPGWVSVLAITPPTTPIRVTRRQTGGQQLWELQPSCANSSGLSGTPAFRLDTFARAFGTLGDVTSVCNSYENALRNLAGRIQSAF